MIVVLSIIVPAIVGSGQHLDWTPCHKQSVRLQATRRMTTSRPFIASSAQEPGMSSSRRLALWWPGGLRVEAG